MKKKVIISGVFLLITIICIVCLAISSSAENTGGTVEQRKDEETFVKTIASTVRLNSTDNTIDAETLANALDRYVGSSKTTVTENANGMLVVTFLETGNAYAVSEESSEIEEGYTNPYLPTGFSYVADTDLDTGLVIQDSSGNQYVWIEVPRSTILYSSAGTEITEFTDEDYTNIENDLHAYTSTYRDGTIFKDEYYSDNVTGLTSDEYYTLKNKMLKSLYQNGGFYIGRYETGIEDTPRTSYGDTTQTPVIKANAYPYGLITCKQVQSLASSMESGEYTSSLMFGVQWDLVLKYLETKGATQSELKKDSTSWGNYINNLWNITNENSKYRVYDYEASKWYDWVDSIYGEKTEYGKILLSTGASEAFEKQNIYDLAGNCSEWTLEYSNNSDMPCTVRGGSYSSYGNLYTACIRLGFRIAYYDNMISFRPTLY